VRAAEPGLEIGELPMDEGQSATGTTGLPVQDQVLRLVQLHSPPLGSGRVYTGTGVHGLLLPSGRREATDTVNFPTRTRVVEAQAKNELSLN
jgi:hypothetical protein